MKLLIGLNCCTDDVPDGDAEERDDTYVDDDDEDDCPAAIIYSLEGAPLGVKLVLISVEAVFNTFLLEFLGSALSIGSPSSFLGLLLLAAIVVLVDSPAVFVFSIFCIR